MFAASESVSITDAGRGYVRGALAGSGGSPVVIIGLATARGRNHRDGLFTRRVENDIYGAGATVQLTACAGP